MVALPWWPVWGEGVTLFGGAVLSSALCLYVLTRGGLRPVPVLAGLTMAALVGYLLGQTLGSLALAGDPPLPARWVTWLRRTWWGAALSPALWLALTLTWLRTEAPEHVKARLDPLVRPAIALALAGGVAFCLAGTFTQVVLQWDQAEPAGLGLRFGEDTQLWHVPDGWLFPVYQAFLVVCSLLAAAILAYLWRASPAGTPLRARFGWLFASAILFLLSGAYLATASGMFGYSALPGALLLITGLTVMGWNVARYGALLAGEVVAGDVVAFAIKLVGLVAIYLAVFLVLAPFGFPWHERVLPVLILLMATHAFSDAFARITDRLLYGPAASALRDRLRLLAARVVRQPDLVTALVDVRESMADLLREAALPLAQEAGDSSQQSAPSMEPAAPAAGVGGAADPSEAAEAAESAPPSVRVLVEGALRHYNDLPTLGQHPLLGQVGRPGDEAAPVLERAARLRAQLEEAIARLRPDGPRPTPGASTGPGGWLHYLVLHEAYAEGRPNKQIMQRYHLSEGTFHRARRRALDALSLDVWQRRPRSAE